MHHTFKLCRRMGIGLAALLLVMWAGSVAAQSTVNTSVQSEYERLYEQIISLRDSGQDVPHELYDRYFELQRQLYPVPEERYPAGQTDQASDGCPGTTITQPARGTPMNFLDAGQTNNAHNSCAYPSCRQGRDVMYKLVLNHAEWLLISTCGSMFDTYLCVFRDSCCGDTTRRVFFNQDAPELCGRLMLQAAIDTCFLYSGTYYITLDGANAGAYGDYVFRITGRPDRICETPVPCTQGYYQHIESEHPNEGVCETATVVECGDGYCGTIDRLGDRDVYRFTLTQCAVVTLSAFGNDTPGQSGYHQGLNPALRLFSGPACDHPIYTNDNVLNSYPDIQGNDARIVTTGGLRAGSYWLEITGVATTGKYEFLITCGPCPE
jgi:hypothetical protein